LLTQLVRVSDGGTGSFSEKLPMATCPSEEVNLAAFEGYSAMEDDRDPTFHPTIASPGVTP
jgi:hypothetical protein